MNNVSFTGLRDIFMGRLGANYCVKAVLFLKSPKNVKQYLVAIHKFSFPDGDIGKKERWSIFPKVKVAPNVTPIREKDLRNGKFMSTQAEKLSFDISRFVEFLSGYTRVDDDIKPIMLYYAMIYLCDFFSRTWLKYGINWGHGIKRLMPYPNDFSVRIDKSGIFPRIVDAFWLLDQPSLFSPDDEEGIGYQVNVEGRIVSQRIEKMKYSEYPEIKLSHLIDVYERLDKIVGSVSLSNPVLAGYVILFIISSISRYRAKDWFEIRQNKHLMNRFERLQYDFLYEWTPKILMETILRNGLKKELSISSD